MRPEQRGLLLIYPLLFTRDKAAVPEALLPTVGIGLSFPKSDTLATVTYIVANKYWEQEFGMGPFDE